MSISLFLLLHHHHAALVYDHLFSWSSSYLLCLPSLLSRMCCCYYLNLLFILVKTPSHFSPSRHPSASFSLPPTPSTSLSYLFIFFVSSWYFTSYSQFISFLHPYLTTLYSSSYSPHLFFPLLFPSIPLFHSTHLPLIFSSSPFTPLLLHSPSPLLPPTAVTTSKAQSRVSWPRTWSRNVPHRRTVRAQWVRCAARHTDGTFASSVCCAVLCTWW